MGKQPLAVLVGLGLPDGSANMLLEKAAGTLRQVGSI